jgi:hypothetical protein
MVLPATPLGAKLLLVVIGPLLWHLLRSIS